MEFTVKKANRERPSTSPGGLHSLKARTFWMHFKYMGVSKHQHSKTYDAEAGAGCHLHILAVTLLSLILHLIVGGFY